jgi:pimeloyl-ACP methyl ester carboxylesterase
MESHVKATARRIFERAASEGTLLLSSVEDELQKAWALARCPTSERFRVQAKRRVLIGHNTVRNQLRAIFDKMGVKRQSDLIRALTELSALAGILDARPETAHAGPDLAAPGIQRITLDDGRALAFRCYGDPDGRNVLYFHEGMGSSLLPPGAEALAHDLGIRVIAPERPGFGQSDPHSDYSFDGVAEDVMTLAHRLGVQTASVLAILSGAPSALQTAARLGDRARSVLICSGRPPRQTRERAGDNPLSIFRARIESNPWVVETLYAVLRMRLSPALVNRMVERAVVHSPSDQAFLVEHPEMISFMTDYVTECLARSSRGPADEIRAFRRGRNLTAADVHAPITVWHGAEDRLAPLPDLLAYLGDKPRDVRVIEDVGYTLALKHWRDMLTFAAA